jgi:DNA invertase Pin-like site-specific DNA recombinase
MKREKGKKSYKYLSTQKKWQKIAEENNFKSEKEMFWIMYVQQRKSTTEIGRELYCANTTIIKRLKDIGIILRPRGGNNYKGKIKGKLKGEINDSI